VKARKEGGGGRRMERGGDERKSDKVRRRCKL
jgi:hypothetical protein